MITQSERRHPISRLLSVGPSSAIIVYIRIALVLSSRLDIEHGLCIIDSVQFPQLSSAAQTNNGPAPARCEVSVRSLAEETLLL